MSAKIVAIDGPAASGKSTVARLVAKKCRYIYVDSGALYRAVTWRVIREKLGLRDIRAVAGIVAQMRPRFFVKSGEMRFRVDGAEPRDELRSEEIDRVVSIIAANAYVRAIVVNWLRSLRSMGNLVVEGRDIGTVVFPRAKWKFYLDAAASERARRRYAELRGRGKGLTIEHVRYSLRRRDETDAGRRVGPLRSACDAVVIDTTSMRAAQVVDFILECMGEKEKKTRQRGASSRRGRRKT